MPDCLDKMGPDDYLPKVMLYEKCEGLIGKCNFFVEIKLEPFNEQVVNLMKAVLACLLNLCMDNDCCYEDGCRFYYEKTPRWLMLRTCRIVLNLLNLAASKCKFMSISNYDGCYGRHCSRYESAAKPKLLFLNVANKKVSLNEKKLIKVLHKIFYKGYVSGCIRIGKLLAA